jgi:GAF domain-containing protein
MLPMHRHSVAAGPGVTVERNTHAARKSLKPGRRTNGQKAAYTLAEVARELAGTLDLERTTSLVVSAVFRLFQVGRSVLYELDEASNRLVCVAAAGKIDPRAWVGRTVPLGEGIVGHAVEKRRTIWIADVLTSMELPRPDWLRTRLREDGYRSLVAVPLIARGKKLGAIVIADRLRRTFTPDDLRLLEAFADQAAVSLEKTRLYEDARRRLHQTETLLAVSRALASTLDLTESMRRVARELTIALGGDIGGAYLMDTSGDVLRPVSGYRVPPSLLDTFLKVAIPLTGHPFLSEAWSSQQPVLSRDTEIDVRIDRATLERFPHRSVIFVPMVVRGEPIGGLFVAWRTARHRFTPEELQLAEGISRQAALAIANARLYAAQEETAEVSAALVAWTESLATARSLDRVIERIARLGPELFGVERCALFLLQPTDGVLVPARAWGLAESLASDFEALRGAPRIRAVLRALESRLPVVVERLALQASVPPGLLESFDVRSVLVVPLSSAEELVGLMTLDSPGIETAFGPARMALARDIGRRAGTAIATAREFQEARRPPDPAAPGRDGAPDAGST